MKSNNQNRKFDFTQSSPSNKKFRHDYSMSDELKSEFFMNVMLQFQRQTAISYLSSH
ncbi:hypothetical protein TMU01_09500 [Tenuibacillus multivorans]|uniref:Uncharacterized protein n=1 Tax=Tenuibacillus multivorans TaxID=237069 RepID=A0A1H0E004_9BACI|nr:hypothetical protein TMU01_09500 [Tenuibacillus multivorans]SDN75571.1 hypothetical protein SAMN05216498_3005 [Tenuibacillus multivorans]